MTKEQVIEILKDGGHFAYAPLPGEFALYNKDGTCHNVANWAEWHELFALFQELKLNCKISFYKEISYGHEMFHGHKGIVQLYGWAKEDADYRGHVKGMTVERAIGYLKKGYWFEQSYLTRNVILTKDTHQVYVAWEGDKSGDPDKPPGRSGQDILNEVYFELQKMDRIRLTRSYPDPENPKNKISVYELVIK